MLTNHLSEPDDSSEASNSNWPGFVTDITYVRILLEGIQRLDSYGMGTSYEAVQEMIDGFEFNYDPIYKVLNDDYGSPELKKIQTWLSTEFGILSSMDVDELIYVTKKGQIPTLITICKYIEHNSTERR